MNRRHIGNSLFVLTSSLLYVFTPLSAATSNPYPGTIPLSVLAAEVDDFATIPNSSGSYPRVNQLLVSPDGTIFVVDQRGPIYQVSADGTSVNSYLDLSTASGVSLDTSFEKGLQSIAFHPDFYNSGKPGYGKLYTIQSSSNRTPAPDFTPGGGGNSHDTVLLEWSTNAPSTIPFNPTVPATPFREVMRLEQPYGNHNAGLIAFNPTALSGEDEYGKLYIAIGDGGSGSDPLNLAQTATNPYGAILRIDPLQSGGDAYTVPSTNPFTTDATKLDEIWAYGLRNPQRFSWDSQNRMFIADIGQGVIEEINLGVKGANYGWKEREGSYEFINGGSVSDLPTRSDSGTTGYTYPIAEYDHLSGSNAVTAGFVYEGSVDSNLRGKFIFSDFPKGLVYIFDAKVLPDGGQDPLSRLRLLDDGVEKSYLDMIKETNSGATRADLRFGQDANRNIYLFNKQDGKVSRLTPLPRPQIRDTSFDGTTYTVQFSGALGITDWQVEGGSILPNFPDDLTGDSVITEPTSGNYNVDVDLSGKGPRYFIRIFRE